MVLPQYFGGEAYRSTPIAQNLSAFSQYFVFVGYFFAIIFGFITFQFISYKVRQRHNVTWYHGVLQLSQWLFFPLIFGLMSIPGLDAQIRGIRGKYLGYWVTPKK